MIAMVSLVIGVTDEFGTDLEHRTWAIGETAQKAVNAWSRRFPDMASRLKSPIECVTSGVPATPTHVYGCGKGARGPRLPGQKEFERGYPATPQ